MRATQYLFSYGTLQDKDVQENLLGRELKGTDDVLPGYRISEKKVHGKHPLIEPCPFRSNEVPGLLFKVSNYELHQIDHYETGAYERITVQLKSGTKAWAYVENLG